MSWERAWAVVIGDFHNGGPTELAGVTSVWSDEGEGGTLDCRYNETAKSCIVGDAIKEAFGPDVLWILGDEGQQDLYEREGMDALYQTVGGRNDERREL